MEEAATVGLKPGEGAQQPEGAAPVGSLEPSSVLQVTDAAVAHIRTLLEKEGISPAEGGLRLGVIGGGCSGHSYSMRLEAKGRESDHLFEFGGVRVFIDPKSFVFLKGMTLDYEQTLIRQGFNFINPNATRSCGCGSSFST